MPAVNLTQSAAAGDAPALKKIGSTSTGAISVSKYLVIGGAILTEVEHPENLKLAVQQKVATHELIGGTRVSQSLGYSFKDVTWTGKLYGNLFARKRQFDQMAASGREQRLKFLDERYDVIILEFEVTYYHRYFYEYTITLRVLRDVSGRFKKGAKVPTSVDTEAQARLAAAQALLVKMTAADAAAAALQNSLAKVQQQIALVSSIASAFGVKGVSDLAVSLTSAINIAENYSAGSGKLFGNQHAVNAGAYADMLRIVLANVKRGQSPATVQVIGGNLTQIAAQYYGDPSVADALRRANNLPGFRLPPGRETTLTLPPLVGTPPAGN